MKRVQSSPSENSGTDFFDNFNVFKSTLEKATNLSGSDLEGKLKCANFSFKDGKKQWSISDQSTSQKAINEGKEGCFLLQVLSDSNQVFRFTLSRDNLERSCWELEQVFTESEIVELFNRSRYEAALQGGVVMGFNPMTGAPIMGGDWLDM